MPIGDGKNEAGHDMEMTARKAKLGQATLTELAQKVRVAAAIGLPWRQFVYVLKINGFRLEGDVSSFTIEREEARKSGSE
ncbi:MAG: hypothetical protein P4M05_23940 [Bradyrhizobium sp.]|nr:hypothetical protein [Bradyrhizobium sp.]